MRIVLNSSGARAAQFSTIIALDPVLDTAGPRLSAESN
jgi:hypothetical protein